MTDYELKALLEAATPAPWSYDERVVGHDPDGNPHRQWDIVPLLEDDPALATIDEMVSLGKPEADRDLIIALVNASPQIVLALWLAGRLARGLGVTPEQVDVYREACK